MVFEIPPAVAAVFGPLAPPMACSLINLLRAVPTRFADFFHTLQPRTFPQKMRGGRVRRPDRQAAHEKSELAAGGGGRPPGGPGGGGEHQPPGGPARGGAFFLGIKRE